MKLAGVRHAVLLVSVLGLVAYSLIVASSSLAAVADVSSGSEGSLGGALVVSGAPTESEELRAAADAELGSPEAVAARVESRTEFEGQDSEQAEKTASEAFATVIEERAGGPPRLPAGQLITGFVDADTARVDLGGGEHGLVQSLVPMALPSSLTGWAPVDLGLDEVGRGYVPANPLVGVRIPSRLAEGVQAPASGLSLTPLGPGGAPLIGSEGRADGATVFYANTSTDTDTVVKPTALGFAVDTMLRSVRSAQHLSFQVGLPQGASLVESKGSGTVEVLEEGVALAEIPAPTAWDAVGMPVPVSMSVSGHVLSLEIDDSSAEFQYPIDVDPEFNVKSDGTISTHTWEFGSATGGFAEEVVYNGLLMKHSGGYGYGQRGELFYRTNGDSRIYQVNTVTEYGPTIGFGSGFELNGNAEDYLEFEGAGGREGRLTISGHQTEGSGFKSQLCATECTPAGGSEHNLIRLGTVVTGPLNAELLELRLMTGTTVSVSQPKETHSTVAYNTSSAEVAGQPNIFHGLGWLSAHSGAFEVKSEDLGLGVAETKFEWYEAGVGWKSIGGEGSPDLKKYLGTSSCAGIQCSKTQNEFFTYANLLHDEGKSGTYEWESVPNGENKVRFSADDAMEHTWSSEHGEGEAVIKVDNAAPHGIAVTGLPTNGESLELGEVEAHINAEVSDGEGAVPSSGIKSVTIGIDGEEVGKPTGHCAPGPCSAKGEWTISGATLGTGAHTLSVVATDNAGNVTSKDYELIVYSASPVAAGPGSVNPESGDYALGATDVDMSGGSGSLAVTRHYDSRNLTEGDEGPLGPQWTVSLGSLASLEVLPDGSVTIAGPEGLTHFAATKTGFTAPAGDTTLTLEYKAEYEGKEPAYLLKNQAKVATTVFRLPTGANSWMPTLSKGAVATDTMTDAYKSVEVGEGKSIVEPTLELAPHPSAECSESQLNKLEIAAKGCRALKLEYYEETTAGEAESEWKAYKNRLKEVIAVAYNPATKAMESTPLAKYEYDARGRLRAEWDPQVAPPLKTIYGYDLEGHVTAVSSAGRQPALLTYGHIAGDINTGRLLAVTVPSASTSFGNGVAPAVSVAPALSTSTPTTGALLSVTNGSWSNGALGYGYQWERCSPGESGKVCTPIIGATNGNYTPAYSDWGYELRATVSATNAVGTVVASSSISGRVLLGPGRYERSSEFGKEGTAEGQLKKPVGITVDREGNVWVVDTGNNRIEKFSPTGAFLKAYGKEGAGNGQFKEPKGIAITEEGYIFVADAGNKRIEEFNPAGEYIEKLALTTAPAGLAVALRTIAGSKWDALFIALPGSNEIKQYAIPHYAHKEFSAFGAFGHSGVGNGQFNAPTGVALNFAARTGSELETKGRVYVTDAGNHRVQILKLNGSSGGALEYSSQFGKSGSGEGQFGSPGAIADITGNTYGLFNGLLVADPGDGRFQQFGESGAYQEQYAETEVQAIAVSAEKGLAYVANTGKSKITVWTPGPLPPPSPEPPTAGTNAITTIEYNVPISGAGAPYAMGKAEVAAWGEKDTPSYATAIFPPDEPMGWPAKNYKRATISYLDNQARAVNIVSPTGAVSTREYNGQSQVTRSLSAENRARALKEPEPIKAAELLDTESSYNSEGQLTDTRGPQHGVRLAIGKEKANEEVLARNHAKYFYDEGAPTGETYNLVTKTTDGAETSSKEEFDKRTATTSYSGQSNLGWKLRLPTSTTTDPGGLNLTSTTKYEEGTGNVIETQSPAGAGKDAATPPAYSSSFGSKGSAGGQFEGAEHDAIDSHANIWVSDYTNHRIEQFSPSGTFMLAVGWGVKDGKAEAETCTTTCRAGISGAGNGEFEGPFGIAVNQSSGNIYVVDYLGNRVQEISPTGAFVASIGSKGTGARQFASPEGLAIDTSGDIWVADTANNRIQELLVFRHIHARSWVGRQRRQNRSRDMHHYLPGRGSQAPATLK